jgi:hypothetical protein
VCVIQAANKVPACLPPVSNTPAPRLAPLLLPLAAVLAFLAAASPPNTTATSQCCFRAPTGGGTTLEYCLSPSIPIGATWASGALAAVANVTLGSCGYRDPLAGVASQRCVENLLEWEVDVLSKLCIEVGGWGVVGQQCECGGIAVSWRGCEGGRADPCA